MDKMHENLRGQLRLCFDVRMFDNLWNMVSDGHQLPLELFELHLIFGQSKTCDLAEPMNNADGTNTFATVADGVDCSNG